MSFLVILFVCALSASGLSESLSVDRAFTKPLNVNLTMNDLKSISPLFEPHIVGGSPVSSAIPYQVSLRFQKIIGNLLPTSLRHFCGASLISYRHALTASHCLDGDLLDIMKAGRMYAVLGTHLRDFKEAGTFVTLVYAIGKHPKYNSKAHHDDIAVIKFLDQVPSNNGNIVPITLGSRPVRVGEKCVISGFGVTQHGDSEGSVILRSANVSYVDKKICSQTYAQRGFELTADMICTGEQQGGIDTCQGDSGGPLNCGGELTGAVSWGIGCGNPGIPGIYASVAFYRQWVLDAMNTLDGYNPSLPRPQTTPYSGARKSTTDIFTSVFVFIVVITRML